MKRFSKWLSLGVSLLAVTSMAACGNSASSSSNSFNSIYNSDPDTLDYLLSNRSTTSDVTSNLVDGLLENDRFGNFVPSLAEEWSVSKDGLTYTYKLRKDAKWYTFDGSEYADVKAEDFITGLKHAADSKSEALYLVQDSIVGLDAYVKGTEKDFSKVGIKALDDHTIQYTLIKPESYWNSKTTMGILFPVNAEFLKSKGKDFGSTKIDSILYNGPYVLSAWTAKSSIEFKKNSNYWDKDAVSIDQVKLSFYDGQDQDSLARNFADGTYSSALLYPTSPNYKTVEKQFKDNIIYAPQDATTYYYTFNVNRKSYKHTAKKDDKAKQETLTAMQNKDFRQAINFAFDRTAYSAQSNGQDGANKVLRNSLVPPSFVQIDNQTFGEVADQETAKLGDEWKGFNSADAQDAFYNKDKAKAEFAKAKEALTAEGVTFPVHLDLPVDQTSTSQLKQAQSLKQSIESSLGQENIVIDLHQLSKDEYQNAVYFAETGAQKDYDFGVAGWGPDYEDPSTYLDILDPDKGGQMQSLGIDPGQNKDLVNKLGLNDYQALLRAADQETSDLKKRYEAYAKAQAWLTDSSLTIPTISKGGVPQLQKTVPFSRANSLVGTKGDATNYKLLKLQDKAVTTKEFEEIYIKYLEEKKESNAKYQEDLAKHVK